MSNYLGLSAQPVASYEIQCYATTPEVLQTLRYKDAQSKLPDQLGSMGSSFLCCFMHVNVAYVISSLAALITSYP